MSKLYTRLSPRFNLENPTGVLICGEDLADSHGFTELGYDMVDSDVPPLVYEVIPQVAAFATEAEAIAAARAAGVVIYDTQEDIRNDVAAGRFSGSWENGDCYCIEEDPINRLVLEGADFRAALEKAGIRAIRDHVAVANTQPELTILWLPDTFALRGPVALAPAPGGDSPYDVVLAEGNNIPAPGPRP
ncbi:hypothetical protein GOB57_24110 [Sinorhizobium meliloti]|nr:hypothetical protein [Sinorhizobium meliloti]